MGRPSNALRDKPTYYSRRRMVQITRARKPGAGVTMRDGMVRFDDWLNSEFLRMRTATPGRQLEIREDEEGKFAIWGEDET